MSAAEAADQTHTAPSLAHRLPDRGIPLLECTLGDLLRRSAKLHPDRRALVWAEGEGLATLTHSQFLEEAERVACWLLERARPGDRIAPWSRNSVDWAVL